MSTNVIIPKLGLTMESAVLHTWMVDEGTEVAVGDAIAEIGTDKIDHEIESPAAGTITDLRAPDEDDELPVGTVIATIH